MSKHSQDQQHDKANVTISTVRHWAVPLSMALLGALVIAGAAMSVEMSDPSRPVVVMTDQHRIESRTEDLHDESDARRKQVASMLREPGEPVPPNLEELQGADADTLTAALEHNDRDVRMRALKVMKEAADPSVCDAIRPLLADDDINIRAGVVAVLSACRDEESVPALIEMVETDASVSRPTGPIEALGDIGDPEAVPCLIDELKSESPAARQQAAKALGNIGDARAVEALVAATDDQSQYIRANAVEALGLIGDPQALDAVIARLGDEEHGARNRAIEALGKIGGPKAIAALEQAIIDIPRQRRAIDEALDAARAKSGDNPPG